MNIFQILTISLILTFTAISNAVFAADDEGTNALSAGELNSLIDKAELLHSELEQSEGRIEQSSSNEFSLIAEYSKLLQQLNDRKLYNKELNAKIKNQNALTAILEDAILRVYAVQESIPPLLSKMVTSLTTIIQNDYPFSLDIRRENLRNARLQLTSDSKLSTKLRQVFDLYESELAYGRTIDVFIDAVDIDGTGQRIEVTVLRWGRVGMYYQTQDGSQSGMYDKENNKWIELPRFYRNELSKAIRMGRKLASLDLVILPIVPPQSSK